MTYRDLLAAVKARYGVRNLTQWHGHQVVAQGFNFMPTSDGDYLDVIDAHNGNVRLERSDGTSQVVPAASAMPFLEAFAAEVLASELG